MVNALDGATVCVEVGAALGKLVQAPDGDTVCLHHDKLRKNLQQRPRLSLSLGLCRGRTDYLPAAIQQ